MIQVGNEPNKATWGLAGVTNAVLSELADVSASSNPARDVVIADWSGFVSPLLLTISASGAIERAERFEPLVELLDLLRGRNFVGIRTEAASIATAV